MRPAHRHTGFTVVELVVVLVLLGILAVGAMSRMPSRVDGDALRLLRELPAIGVLARQRALADSTAVFGLRLLASADGFAVSVLRNGSPVFAQSLPGRGLDISVAAGAAVGAVDAGHALLVSFDAVGAVAAVSLGATAGSAAAGVALTISSGGVPLRNLCVHPTGAVLDDACT